MRKGLSYLAIIVLCLMCLAPNRRPHDHIGNFNFKFTPVLINHLHANFVSNEVASLECPDAGDAESRAIEFRGEINFQQLRTLEEGSRTLRLAGADKQHLTFTFSTFDEARIIDGQKWVRFEYSDCY